MKTIITLIILTIGSSSLVAISGLLTTDRRKYNNDFLRIFPPHAADPIRAREMPGDRYQLAGITDTRIYLNDRLGVLSIGRDMRDSLRIPLDFPFGSEIVIDSPYFFIHNGDRATVRRGLLRNWQTDTTFDIKPFTAIQMVSTNSAVTRKIRIGEREHILARSRGLDTYTLKKQVDGILCTDGLLQYSRELHQLVYVYRYRNQFVCLDTCLNPIRYGKTIDTTTVAKIAVEEIDGKITMSRPPMAVNNDAIVDGKYLFVQSNLVARNEIPENAKDRSVIDVYNILDGSYRHSFYIENYMGSRMRGFLVKDSILVAIFKRAVVTYDLPSAYLP